MSTHVTTLPSESCEIPPEDHQLLRDALKDWYATEVFTDDHVTQVKAVFRKIFTLPDEATLVGSVLPDAIIMQPEGDSHTFYVLMRPEDPADQGWEARELTCEGMFCWAKDIPFRTVLFLLSHSAGGMTEAGPGLEILSSSGSEPDNS